MEYLIPISIIIVIVIAVALSRRGGTPSVEMFAKINKAVRDLQCHAAQKIMPAKEPGKMTGFDERKMQDLTVTIDNVIRLAYTMEHYEEGILHTISSQLTCRKPRKYQIECMLVVMLTLNEELTEAGVNHDEVKFEITESELGTHYVGMHLNVGQQALMAEKIWDKNNT